MERSRAGCPAVITIYQPDQQGTGAFDGGRITGIKPIGGDSLRVVIIEVPAEVDYPLHAEG